MGDFFGRPLGFSAFRLEGPGAQHNLPGANGASTEQFGEQQVEFRASVFPCKTQQLSLRWTAAFGAGEFSEEEVYGTTYRDHVRTVSVRADYSLKDPWGGQNYVGVGYRRGIDDFGASQSNDPFTSRWAAPDTFSVVDLSLARIQTITDAWSLKLSAAAQFASAPLLSSQQFYLGGGAFGRGYDAALIGGDNGVAGSAELRFDQKVNSTVLRSFQVYWFADAGTVWDADGDREFLSLASTGLGLRGYFADGWQGGLAVAFPVRADTLAEVSYAPRLLFSLSKTLKACPERSPIWCG